MPPAILPVIMAGGAGTRLWPVSGDRSPKQFQPLTGPRSTFEQTLRRLSDRPAYGTPLVVTAESFAGEVKIEAAKAGVHVATILEPMRRDSAAAIAVATLWATARNPETLLLVLAADQLVTAEDHFHTAVLKAAAAAEKGLIAVFGIAPDEPRTSYGYIRRGAAIADGVAAVEAFVEKPDAATAARYVAEGYLWNSGNFLFRADVMLQVLNDFAPDILGPVRDALAAARPVNGGLLLDPEAFAKARKVSIDYAVMEKARNIAVVEGRFGWSDIGSWDAVWQALPHDANGNAIVGDGHARDSRNTLIHATDQRIIAAGVEDLAIIARAGTVLVLPKSQSQAVKPIAEAFAEIISASSMPRPVAALDPKSLAFETTPLVKPSGFREYDARWWLGHPAKALPPELNLMGAQALGLGLGTFLARRGQAMDIVTAHDYRSYSQAIKLALVQGLVAAGCRVRDIGLAVTPMAYFAQFALDVPSVAMVTASHNDNGWTGVKMGCQRPVTFGPDDMAALHDIVLAADFREARGGSYSFVPGFADRYIADLTSRQKFTRRLSAVVACGNGTAGAFAPQILERLGVEVIPLHVELDHSFPNYNPNPEDLAMLHDIAGVVQRHGADLGLGFDGDGDRCGVVDNQGNVIFADKIGLMLARDLSALHPGSRFVVDVKSTCLYGDDQVLRRNGATTDYFKTGHSYIKRRVQELQALAGFEKSGHFFFNAPIGRGYDDGMLTAIAILDMLDRNPGSSMAELYRALPRTWGSPTMSAHCGDEEKYHVVSRLTARLQAIKELAGQPVTALNLVNGVRITVADGTWGLVRASSNKPELVVVVESPVSEARLRHMFKSLDALLRENPEVGAYNQTI